MPERTISVGPSNGWIWAVSSGGFTPALDWTRIASSWPGLWKSCCAVGWSRMAKVAPPTLTLGNSAIPLMRSLRDGPNACTPIRSPTWKPLPLAVALSITTASGPCGQWPAVSFVGLKGWPLCVTEKPSEGAPPVEITFPFLPISFSESLVTEPAASATPGSLWIFGSSDCGIVGGSTVLPPALSNAALPVITTSAFWYDCLKIVLKPLLIVSVRT